MTHSGRRSTTRSGTSESTAGRSSSSVSTGLRTCGNVTSCSSRTASRIADVVRRVGDLSVLTVGETQDLARHGAVINFRIEDNRVRFDINVDAAKRSHLTISSKLLNLARIVRNP